MAIVPLAAYRMEVVWIKAASVQLACLAVLLSFAIGGGLREGIKLPAGPILPIAALCAILLASLAYSTSPFTGTRAALLQAANPLVFLLASILLSGREGTKSFYTFSLAAAAAVAFYGICQANGLFGAGLPRTRYGDPSPCSTFGLTNYAAEYIVGIVPGILYITITEEKMGALSAKLAAILLVLYYFLFIKVRAGYAGAAAMILLFILLLAFQRNRLKNPGRIAGAIAGAALAFALLLAATDMGSVVITRFTSSFNTSETQIRFRLLTWQAGLKMFLDRPMFGAGLGNFQVFSPLYESDELAAILEGSNVVTDKAHNDPLELLSESGVVGLGAFAWVLISVGLSIRRTGGVEALSARAAPLLGMAGILAASLFAFPLQNPASSMVFWASAGMLCAPGRKASAWRARTGFLAAAAFSAIAFVTCSRFFLAESHKMEGAYLMNMAKFDEALVELNSSRELNPYFDSITYFDLAITRARLGDLDGAIGEIKNVIRINPYSGKAYMMLAGYYSQKGDKAEEAQAMEKALKIRAVKKEEFYYGAIDSLVKAGEYARAAGVAVEALEKFPRSSFMRYKMGNIRFYTGDYVGAAAEYARAIGMDPGNPTFYHNLVTAHFAAGKIEEAAEGAKKGIAAHPETGYLHYDLALLEAAAGRQDEALASLKRAIELAPSLAEKALTEKYFEGIKGSSSFKALTKGR
jgi:O-antigen ligase/Flp pilus assembly protein TadD